MSTSWKVPKLGMVIKLNKFISLKNVLINLYTCYFCPFYHNNKLIVVVNSDGVGSGGNVIDVLLSLHNKTVNKSHHNHLFY